MFHLHHKCYLDLSWWSCGAKVKLNISQHCKTPPVWFRATSLLHIGQTGFGWPRSVPSRLWPWMHIQSTGENQGKNIYWALTCWRHRYMEICWGHLSIVSRLKVLRYGLFKGGRCLAACINQVLHVSSTACQATWRVPLLNPTKKRPAKLLSITNRLLKSASIIQITGQAMEM